MFPTFVIGLREGLEAALIVGIIAAFLRRQGRKDLLRSVFAGVGIAVAICLAAGITLKLVSQDLPERQQEGMETVIAAIAVVMVTYMVVWMKRHSRDLKGQLEGMAADAIGGSSGAGRAMIVMAFLAVLREGIETAVFLLATFNEKHSGASAPIGALLGLGVAVALGYGIYRGGVRLNLSKFFRATGLVLVLVAAGLVVNALHTAHEANWLNAGQSTTLDLTGLVRPGSIQSSLLTGMLGIQAKPVVIETLGWLLYLIPVGLYVAWPPGKGLARRTTSRVLLAGGALSALVAVVLFAVMPARPAAVSGSTTLAGLVVTPSDGRLLATDHGTAVRLSEADAVVRDGVRLEVWKGRTTVGQSAPIAASYDRIAALNGGRLPIGIHPSASGSGSLRYTDVADYAVTVDPSTHRVVGIDVARKTIAALVDSGRSLALDEPVSQSSVSTPGAVAASALRSASNDRLARDRRTVFAGFGWFAGALALVLFGAGGALTIRPRAAQRAAADHTPRVGTLVGS